MGLQLPRRTAGKPVTIRRMAALAAVGISVLVLGGCSSETTDEWKRAAMPDTSSINASPEQSSSSTGTGSMSGKLSPIIRAIRLLLLSLWPSLIPAQLLRAHVVTIAANCNQ